MTTTKFTGILTASACVLLTGTSPLGAADVTYERLINPEPHNWLMIHHDYNSQRFSSLDSINKSNVKTMRLLFAVALGGTCPGGSSLRVDVTENDSQQGVQVWTVQVITYPALDAIGTPVSVYKVNR